MATALNTLIQQFCLGPTTACRRLHVMGLCRYSVSILLADFPRQRGGGPLRNCSCTCDGALAEGKAEQLLGISANHRPFAFHASVRSSISSNAAFARAHLYVLLVATAHQRSAAPLSPPDTINSYTHLLYPLVSTAPLASRAIQDKPARAAVRGSSSSDRYRTRSRISPTWRRVIATHASSSSSILASASNHVAHFRQQVRTAHRRSNNNTPSFASNMATISAQPSASIDIPYTRARHANNTAIAKQGAGLLTPPSSISPLMPAHHANNLKSPPLLNIVEEDVEMDMRGARPATPPQDAPTILPLSVGALSGLDASAAITPSLLASDYLPAIMLGNGPQPIRHLMAELNQTLPGFSRIPPAKARRLVVAALEGRGGGGGGGRDANIAFCKTGWGRWDAHEKGSQGDTTALYAQSMRSAMQPVSQSLPAHGKNGVAEWARAQSMVDGYDDVDMDGVDQDADNMSMEEGALDDRVFSSEVDDDGGSDVTDDDDWAAVGPAALRKASLPAPGQPAPPRTNYQALGVPIFRPSAASWRRRFSTVSDRSAHSATLSSYSPHLGPMQAGVQTPEEQVAIEALLRMGSI